MYKIRSVLNKLILTHIIISYYYYDVIKDTYRDTYKSSINTYKVTQTEQNKLISYSRNSSKENLLLLLLLIN